MSRIEIRGVIVPSNYDVEWTRQYIEKGIITPESHVRNAMAKADKSQPMDVYINSPGGSVFAAYEIINALAQWRADHKQAITVTVGAMAASAASAIAILSGADVRVHRNSKLMFHGAWSETIGGDGAHKDTADLLAKINADIKTQLVSRYGLAPELVDEWFAEGRMGWLTAQDAMKHGMAKEVVDADDADIEFADADVAGIEANGLKIAAMLPKAQAEEKPEEDGDAGNKSDNGAAPGEAEQTAEDKPDVEHEPAQRTEAEIGAEIERRVELVISDRLAVHLEAIEDLKAKLAAKETERANEQSQKDKAIAHGAKEKQQFESQLSETKAALERANARLAKWSIGSLTFSPSIESWAEAMAACGNDYAKARETYPDAYDAFMNQKQPRKR